MWPLKWEHIVKWWGSTGQNTGQTSPFWMNYLRVTAFWQLFNAVSWSTSAMLPELKTSLQAYYAVASMVPDLEADQNDAGQMMWRTRPIYRFQSASSRWLETEQYGVPSCRHHWSSVFRNDEEPTTITKVQMKTLSVVSLNTSLIENCTRCVKLHDAMHLCVG